MSRVPPYRDKAIDAYGEACVICGSFENVHVHHIDRDRENDALDNLVPLCQEHHQQVHLGGHPYTAFFALGDPFLTLLDDITYARGYHSRAETMSRALLELVEPADTHTDRRFRADNLANSRYWELGACGPHRYSNTEANDSADPGES